MSYIGVYMNCKALGDTVNKPVEALWATAEHAYSGMFVQFQTLRQVAFVFSVLQCCDIAPF